MMQIPTKSRIFMCEFIMIYTEELWHFSIYQECPSTVTLTEISRALDADFLRQK